MLVPLAAVQVTAVGFKMLRVVSSTGSVEILAPVSMRKFLVAPKILTEIVRRREETTAQMFTRGIGFPAARGTMILKVQELKVLKMPQYVNFYLC